MLQTRLSLLEAKHNQPTLTEIVMKKTESIPGEIGKPQTLLIETRNTDIHKTIKPKDLKLSIIKLRHTKTGLILRTKR